MKRILLFFAMVGSITGEAIFADQHPLYETITNAQNADKTKALTLRNQVDTFEPLQVPIAYTEPARPNIIFVLDNSGWMARTSASFNWGQGDRFYYNQYRNFEQSLRNNLLEPTKGTRYTGRTHTEIKPFGLAQVTLQKILERYDNFINVGYANFLGAHPHWNQRAELKKRGLSYSPINYPDIADFQNTIDRDQQSRDTYFPLPLTHITDEKMRSKVLNIIYRNDPHRGPGEEVNAHTFNKYLDFKHPPATYAQTIYEISKYLRGYPILSGVEFMPPPTGSFNPNINGSRFENWGKPSFTQLPYPQQYRCQENHIILLTIGLRHTLDGTAAVLPHDKLLSTGRCMYEVDHYGSIVRTDRPADRNIACPGEPFNVASILQGDRSYFNIAQGFDLASVHMDLGLLGRQLGLVDLRTDEGSPGLRPNRPDLDQAGREWTDEGSEPMKINIHTLLLGNFADGEPHEKPQFKRMAEETGGTFHTEVIPRKIEDHIAKIVETALPPKRHVNYVYDQTYIGPDTTLYRAKYDPNQWSGEVVAYRLRPKSDQPIEVGESIDLEEIWTTSDKFNQQAKGSSYDPYISTTTRFNPSNQVGYRTTDGPLVNVWNLHAAAKAWYTKGERQRDEQRSNPTLMADIVNSNLAYYAPDIFHGNLAHYSPQMIGGVESALRKRIKRQSYSIITAHSNEGFVNHIRGERNIRETDNSLDRYLQFKKGERINAFLLDLHGHNFYTYLNYKHSFRMDGEAQIFDYAYKHPGWREPRLHTIILSMQGAGGKGFRVGHLSKEQGTLRETLYYINDRQFGFEDLGYTMGRADFIATKAPLDTGNTPHLTVDIVMGNGYGSANHKSLLYIIGSVENSPGNNRAIIRKKITLNPKGGGAGSPAITTRMVDDGTSGRAAQFSVIDKIYVGDLSGGLYRVELPFNVSSYQYGEPKVTKIFQDPHNHPIHAQPVVVQDRKNVNWIYFGTGLDKREADKYDYADDIFHFYGLRDNDLNYTVTPNRHNMLMQKIKAEEIVAITPDGVTETKVDLTHYNKGQALDPQYHGWQIPLALYSDNQLTKPITSGERVVSPAVYFSHGGEVLGIKTWGIKPGGEAKPLKPDPCLTDVEFSKLLYVNLWTGGKATNKDGKEVDGHGTEGGEISYPLGPGIQVGSINAGGNSLDFSYNENLKIKGNTHNEEKDSLCPSNNWVVINGKLRCLDYVNHPDSSSTPHRIYIKSLAY